MTEHQRLQFEAISLQQGLMGDGAQGDDDFQLGHGREFVAQMSITLTDLRRCRLVGRRQAAHGIGDPAIAELHGRIGPLVSPQRLGNAGKAEAVQRRVQQFAGHIASERSSGTVGTTLARAEADDEQFGVEAAKGGNGQCVPVRVALTDAGKMRCQTRAGSTGGRVFENRHGRDVSMSAMQLHWDIFCRVVDNYGDIGVCWRLSRQLVAEHGKQVRLWVDELAALQAICPEVSIDQAEQRIAGVDIRQWTASSAVNPVFDVIVEAFACEPPAAYIEAMAAAPSRPCWINLEYLTAEPWALSCHGMASPHPSLPLVKHFYFPGFGANTGGLLREDGVGALAGWSGDAAPAQELTVSLFCYETAPVADLLAAFEHGSQPVRCLVPPGKPLVAVSAALGGNGPWQRGQLTVEPVPFLAMDDYDALLRRCDLNFVRGEDSFLRAQWAGKPFVWQIYRQDEDAHLPKLEAFLDAYCAEAPPELALTIRQMFRAWNLAGEFAGAWATFNAARTDVARHHARWLTGLLEQDDLATRLVKFCASKV